MSVVQIGRKEIEEAYVLCVLKRHRVERPKYYSALEIYSENLEDVKEMEVCHEMDKESKDYCSTCYQAKKLAPTIVVCRTNRVTYYLYDKCIPSDGKTVLEKVPDLWMCCHESCGTWESCSNSETHPLCDVCSRRTKYEAKYMRYENVAKWIPKLPESEPPFKYVLVEDAELDGENYLPPKFEAVPIEDEEDIAYLID